MEGIKISAKIVATAANNLFQIDFLAFIPLTKIRLARQHSISEFLLKQEFAPMLFLTNYPPLFESFLHELFLLAQAL